MKSKPAATPRRAFLLVVGGAKTIAKVSHRTGKLRGRRRARDRSSRGLALFLVGLGIGVSSEYLLDPQHGKRRRHVLRDFILARFRRGSREAGKTTRHMAGKAQGLAADATPPRRDITELNDPTLAAKVESELFKPKDAPKATVDVNVENGVVFLRGEVASREQLKDLIDRAQAVDGVIRAESLLHLPGEPAGDRS